MIKPLYIQTFGRSHRPGLKGEVFCAWYKGQSHLLRYGLFSLLYQQMRYESRGALFGDVLTDWWHISTGQGHVFG